MSTPADVDKLPHGALYAALYDAMCLHAAFCPPRKPGVPLRVTLDGDFTRAELLAVAALMEPSP